jgi:flagellar hook-basal body protein
MIRALYTAASGMSAQQMNLDTIANNLANSSTTGFRQLRLQFQDMVYQNMVTPGAAQSQNTVSAGLQIGLGTRPAATEVINTQGEMNETDNPLDAAIQGAGFFQVQRPDGTIAYTRAGQFHLNNQGTVVTTDGDPLIPTITIPSNATAVTITQYGVVNATLAGQQNPSQLGQTDSTGNVSQSRRPREHGQQPAAGHAQLGRSGPGQSRRNRRPGHAATGVSRELECGRRHRICANGSGAARLRIELQGNQGGGRHVFASE